MSPNNLATGLENTLQLLFLHFDSSIDFVVKRISAQVLKELVVDFAGCRLKTAHFAKKHAANENAIISESSDLFALFGQMQTRLA